ncbi:MAG: HAD family hydrolase [bacterium]
MIKLIASDVDGTLIHDYTDSVNPELFEIIKKFLDKDVLFFVASGRQHSNLKRVFEPIKDDIGFISENGALVFYKGDLIKKDLLDRELVSKIVPHVIGKDKLEICICCQSYTYLIPKSQEFADYLSINVNNDIKIVSSLDEIKEDVIKISFYSPDGITSELQDEFLNTYSGQISQCMSAKNWYELMPLNSHKGNSIKHLQELLSISPEETLVFGDNFNDREMLQDAKYSYAMENANQELKNLANYTCDDVCVVMNELYDKFFG